MESPTAGFDRACMELAIQEARKATSENTRLHPAVGVVAAKDTTVLGAAFRGESTPGGHAEYVLLERKLREASLIGATIYITLEPCNQSTPSSHPMRGKAHSAASGEGVCRDA